MRPTERSARKPSTETGLRATLRGLLHAQGSGAPRRPRALVMLATFATALGALAFMSAPALAAAPETPTTLAAESVTGSGATLRGVLDPGQEGGPGTFEIDTYEFLYNKASAGECKGGSKTPAAMSLGGGMEPVGEPVTGLESDTKYLVCLAASNGVEAVGAPVSFITAPETPEDAVSEVTGTSAKFSGVLEPKATSKGEPGSYAFRYSSSGSGCGATYTAGGGEMTGDPGQAVSVVAGLQPDTTYTFCLVAMQPGEEAIGAPVTFKTLDLAPAISAEGTGSVGSNEATVGASIVPGAPTTRYHVEYGTSTSYGTSTTAVSLGTGASAVSVQVRLGGLLSGTKYHFRFVAENEPEGEPVKTEVGADETFVTTASASGSTSVLPDNRVYELVSSATENVTVNVVAGLHGVFEELEGDAGCYIAQNRAAADGDAVAYAAEPATEGGNGSFSDGLCNQWVATRGPTAWTASDVTPPGTDESAEYSFFSSDLSVAIFNADFQASIAVSPAPPPPPPSCQYFPTMYSRSGDGAYHAVVVASPVTPGKCGIPKLADSSADDTHLVFSDGAALTVGAEPSPAEYDESGNLYDLVDGSLHQVNVLPDGRPETASHAWLGGPPLEVDGGAASPDFSNAISSDGSRIYWTSVEVEGNKYIPKALYLRENDTQPQSPGGECTVSGDACTVQVDAGEAKCVAEAKCTSGGGLFWTATADGSKVFFTDANRLTASSTAEPGEPDLYEYEVATGLLTDLTVAGAGHANVQSVIGASENGEYVYFAAEGVLASNTTADGETAQEGKVNVYVLHGGVTTFISSDSGGINEGIEKFGSNFSSDEEVSDLSRGPNERTAEVTPDGQEMVFESFKSLTGYDNKKGVVVYIYDASTGRISCVSCDPAGAPQFSAPSGSLLPVTDGSGDRLPAFMMRWMSASGSRVFFDTAQSLVPEDTNGLMDVYEWERAASGSEANNSCSTSSESYSEVNGGCVFLLSGGQSSDTSYFADADAEGNNVFFTSRGQLTPRAGDENMAMYDARVDGGFPELSTECTGTGCQGVPPAPPIFATPSSATFNGVGNFPPETPPKKVAKKAAKCKKGLVKNKKGQCIKKKRKKSKQAKRASRNRRTKS
jgi:hypothetical protein